MTESQSESVKKAEVLIEAIPYIRKFRGSVVVVKYGGSAMIDAELKQAVITDIAMLKYIGLKPVVVHGGGKDISSMLKKLGKESIFIDGLRVTDKETARVAEMVLSGSVGKELAKDLEDVGIHACSISGKDGRTLIAKKKLDEKGRDLGFVGEITNVDTTLINTLLDADFVPVISPIGVDAEGSTYNINADYVASAIAGALEAQKLIFMTDVEGILREKDNKDSLIKRLSKLQAVKLIKEGVINGGMIPKTECCIDALHKGVKSVHVLDGRVPHSILLEIFTEEGIGTMLIN